MKVADSCRILVLKGTLDKFSHFLNGGVETKEGEVTCPKPQMKQMVIAFSPSIATYSLASFFMRSVKESPPCLGGWGHGL